MIKLGPTGKFPEGKLNDGDDGELQFAVGNKDGNVVLIFGVPTKWLAMPPDKARAFAQGLLLQADYAEGKKPS